MWHDVRMLAPPTALFSVVSKQSAQAEHHNEPLPYHQQIQYNTSTMSFRKNCFSSLAVFFVLLISGTQAFCPASPISRTTAQATASPISSTTALEERRWNFNEGQSPWGLKTNAEVWNGRVAQVSVFET